MAKLVEVSQSVCEFPRMKEGACCLERRTLVCFVVIAPAMDIASVHYDIKGAALELVVCVSLTPNGNEKESWWSEAREMALDELAGIGTTLGEVLTDGLRYAILLASVVNSPNYLRAELAANTRLEVGIGLARKHHSYAIFPCLPNDSIERSVDLVSGGAIWLANRSLAVSRTNLIDV